MVVLIAGTLLALSIFVEIYLVISFIRSKNGKYPPYFPSFGRMRKTVISEANQILKKSTSPTNIVDLGCGDGSLLRSLAKNHPQHHFKGYEWSSLPYKLASYFSKPYKNIKIYKQDFMKTDLKETNLVICFLSNEIAPEVSAKLKKELSKGSIIISAAFALPNIKLIKEIQTKNYGFLLIKVFVYEI